MAPSASQLLLLLLSLSQALPVQMEGQKHGEYDVDHHKHKHLAIDGYHDENKDLADDGAHHEDKDWADDGAHDGDQQDVMEGEKKKMAHEGYDDTEHVDISTRILTANDGSDELLLEGDMMIPKSRNAMKCLSNNCWWEKSYDGLVIVPYVIGNEYTSSERQTIEGAMAGFASQTCIRFTPRTNENDYVMIQSKSGCYSEVGKIGGMQDLSLSQTGCIYNGVAQHELNHALGFQHEHTRSDRDSYVVINWQNIMENQAYNFYKHDTNNLNTPYDYSSIMHYGRDAFSVAYGYYTITPIPNPNTPIGQRDGLSYWDVRRINILYNC